MAKSRTAPSVPAGEPIEAAAQPLPAGSVFSTPSAAQTVFDLAYPDYI